jgi:hypothetical protein
MLCLVYPNIIVHAPTINPSLLVDTVPFIVRISHTNTTPAHIYSIKGGGTPNVFPFLLSHFTKLLFNSIE